MAIQVERGDYLFGGYFAVLLALGGLLLALGCSKPPAPTEPPVSPGLQTSPSPAVEAAAFDLVLASAGESKILAIKLVREVTGLGLRESKELVDGAPRVVKQALPRAEAEALAKRFREAGLGVEVRPHAK